MELRLNEGKGEPLAWRLRGAARCTAGLPTTSFQLLGSSARRRDYACASKRVRALKMRTILFRIEKAPLKTRREARDSAPWCSGPRVP